MIYVLIFTIKMGYGIAIDHIEFSSLEKCETAGKMLESKWTVTFGPQSNWVCVPK